MRRWAVVLERLIYSPLNYWGGLGLDAVVGIALVTLGLATADHPVAGLGAVAIGVAIYSFYEYGIHRWTYHRWPSAFRRVHRDHHRDRTVQIGAPFFFSLSVCALSWAVASAVVGGALGAAVAGTILLGYASQSAVHHLCHSDANLPAWLDRRRRHHLHHHGHGATNFGILFRFWDRAFGTLAARPLSAALPPDARSPRVLQTTP